MPAAIGPLGPLLAEPAQSRSEPSEPGRGTAFAKILETSGRAGNASAEEERDQSDGSGNAAALAFSTTAHASHEETEAENTEAPVEESVEAAEIAASTGAPVVAAANDVEVDAEAEADEANEGDTAVIKAMSSEAVSPKAEAATAEQTTEGNIPVETKDDAPAEIKPAEATPTDTASPSAVSPDVAKADEAPSNPKVQPATAETETSGVGIVSPAPAEDAEAAKVDEAKVAELKAEKAERRDNAVAASAQLKGNEAPGRPDLVMASLNPAARTEDREVGRLKDVPATGLTPRAARAETVADGTPRLDQRGSQPAITIPQGGADNMMESSSFLSGGLEISAQATDAGDSGKQAATLSLAAGVAPAAAPAAAPAPAAGAAGFGAMMAPTQATIVAAPQEIVDIVSNKLAGGDKPDRILVQLDPPELGRVSIEFKFDAQGLQQVAVRADTPEAMKQLRLLHFDLVQSLEQHGLSARDMTFSEGSANGSRNQQLADLIDYTAIADEDAVTVPAAALARTSRTPNTIGASGLNIKL